MANPRDPRLKLFVTWRCLQFRRTHAELFQRGEYLPLAVDGTAAKHLCAFAWRLASADGEKPRTAVVAAPRWIAELMKTANEVPPTSPPLGAAVWRDTCLQMKDIVPFDATHLFTGQVHKVTESQLPAADIFSNFPVAVLVSGE
jgi:(1->4)-alpha-D-glucan 1-alpha-D-glucosylmutase